MNLLRRLHYVRVMFHSRQFGSWDMPDTIPAHAPSADIDQLEAAADQAFGGG